ncbi:hypothetical protein D3C71_1296320 [compost metagenome]
MVQRGRERLHCAGGGVVLRGVAGAVVGAGGHVDGAAVERRNAEVRQALVARVGVLQQQVGLRRELERERRREVVALDELLVAVAAGVFHGGVDAEGGGIADAHIHVGRGAAVVEIAQAQRCLARGLAKLGLLGHAVDQATRRSAPVQHCGRALEHFHTLDVGQVTEVQRVVAHAIHKLVGDGGKAAYHHLVALAVAMAHGHARHVAQRVLHGARALVAQELRGHHVHRLGHVAQRRAALGGRAGGGGRIAVVVRAGLHGDLAQRLRRGLRNCRGRRRRLRQCCATQRGKQGGHQRVEAIGGWCVSVHGFPWSERNAVGEKPLHLVAWRVPRRPAVWDVVGP